MEKHNKLYVNKHERYFLRFLDILPSALEKFDATRVLLTYFCVSGLDILNALDKIDNKKREAIINWIYKLQVVNEEEEVSGFQGSSTLSTIKNKSKNSPLKWGHITATYTALCTLVILGDDLSRVNRKAIAHSLKKLQLPSGCFTAAKEGTESDMRFVFSVASVCYLIDDWSGMDVDKTIDFILKSISYDNGIGQEPGAEAHGGSTYCAIATLALCKRLNSLSRRQLDGIIRWLVFRQQSGFQGRPNKPVDTCYSFWVGGALKILGVYDLIDFQENYTSVILTQSKIMGGFAKWVGLNGDPLHSYLGLAGLTFMKLEKCQLNQVVPELNITVNAFQQLKVIHDKWRSS
ncbi:geranylgeranyl transferase type-1 subunit beta [Agrilus planipennis]|uniref:Geranylgeranyl transferase type-1 subunit beta n=1 Tax=Agrilus planipennis TaxID=224129 RepID=A0A1W4W9L1_AGRPL|nr:geranylgeranyl transferase type-1 subunit beta [Agrilus planipennis]